jgi:endonuclease/exonuclease/phosphatase family metal-dependent hydrolase
MILCCPSITLSQILRVASVNCWSGLDYQGTIRMGEHETSTQREKRFQLLVDGLRKQNADVIALQEVNPVADLTSRLADSLGFDYIYQRVNAGFKIYTLGIPTNLNEGIALLARKSLNIKFVDVWELSSGIGVIGNTFSLHFSEKNIALVGKISINGRSLFVLNCHLSASVPADSLSIHKLQEIILNHTSKSHDLEDCKESLMYQSNERKQQIANLIAKIGDLNLEFPIILLGDFNATPDSRELSKITRDLNFLDVFTATKHDSSVTWDPVHNSNIVLSHDTTVLSERKKDPLDLLATWYDGFPRRIDYILLSSLFQKNDIQNTDIFLNEPQDGLFASDHYGVYTVIDVTGAIREGKMIDENQIPLAQSQIEPLPIISYDTDVGFGYGAKAFFLNQLRRNESFDVVAFNSTKGERWYRFVFSLPDYELRQGKVYPWAVDVVVDYDKWIRNSYFGVGNDTRYEDREFYTREPFESSVSLSRGFSSYSVGQAGLKYKFVRNSHFENSSRLKILQPSVNSSDAKYISLFASYRFDTRDSYINPSNGYVAQSEIEYAPTTAFTNVTLTRISGWFQSYSVLFYPKTVIAFRMGITTLLGNDLPVQNLMSIGGNQTLRGSPQDRYLDKSSALMNLEIRYPIIWRFGGVIGLDAGKVWSGLGKIDLYNWAWNSVMGLRFYMDTFVVRLDVGFGNETTGFYLNFGQLF